MITLNYLILLLLFHILTASGNSFDFESNNNSDESDLELDKCNPLIDNHCLVTNEALGRSIFETFQTGTKYFAITSSRNRIKFDPNGLQLTIKKMYDNPALISSFYIMYGKVEVDIKGAYGQGIISSFYLQSDDLDEIDIGEIFGGDPYEFQSNYFIKGNVSTYDRGRYHKMGSSPLGQFHRYGLEWNPENITWFLDGQKVRVVNKRNKYGFPSSPMFIKFSLWAGGDYLNDQGTIAWAGGITNYEEGPFTMTIKNLNVADYSTGVSYSYGNLPGREWLSLTSNGGEIYRLPQQVVPPPPPITTRTRAKTKTKVPKSQLLHELTRTTNKETSTVTKELYQLPEITKFSTSNVASNTTTRKTHALYTTTISITKLLDQNEVIYSTNNSSSSLSLPRGIIGNSSITYDNKFIQDTGEQEKEENIESGVSQVVSVPIAIIFVIISVITWL
ncbi:Extracellular glycosidase CRH12 [Spathaspora sp. JA1]|nr:Extracellular glycosidase CRH12 [Spathaspora sp. JA1]